MLLGWIQLIVGLALLVFAGDFLVRSAVKIASFLRVSPMVVGLTIVSFGTSFPELVVSVNAALSGHPDISMGNVVGSNIANLALVLGVTALLKPIEVNRSNVVFDWPVMLIISVATIIFSLNGVIELWQGALMVTMLLAYNFWIFKQGRKASEEEFDLDEVVDTGRLLKNVGILVLSLSALIFGADILVDGAVIIARDWGVEERVIAVSIIAFGTSAPELATSIMAIRKSESGLSLGNLIGSNIFNLLGILGVTSILEPIHVSSQILNFDYYWFLLIPLTVFPVILFRRKVERWLGVLLLMAYFTYIFLIF